MTSNRDYSVTTPLMEVHPEKIRVVPVSAGDIQFYQERMSRAVWRPSFGRKLGFLVVHDEHLLGLIFLATPTLRLACRDKRLFPDAPPYSPTASKEVKAFYGRVTKEYMDMSVCVASQPIGWYWRIGKLLAMIAYTLGDFVEARYPESRFKGVTTTAIYGRGTGTQRSATQYDGLYKYLGETEGSGHENVDNDTMKKMVAFLRAHCPNCTPGCERPLEPKASVTQIKLGELHETDPRYVPNDPKNWCVVPGCRWVKGVGGDGASPRRRRIAAFFKALHELDDLTPEQAIGLSVMGAENVEITKKAAEHHGRLRSVYFHPAVPSSERPAVILKWYKRWGRKGYDKLKDQQAPYQSGLEGGRGVYPTTVVPPKIAALHSLLESPAVQNEIAALRTLPRA